MRYVIVGNSFAGTFAIEAIRDIDCESEIILIGDEPQRLYSRAVIHEYLAGHVDQSKMHLRKKDFHQQMNVKTICGRAEKLDTENQQVIVDGDPVDYDKILIATGTSPFIPPGIENLDTYHNNVFTFTRQADVEAIMDRSGEIEHIVVLGAGLIGLQAGEALAQLGKKVSIVELADQILPLAADKTAANMLKAEMEKEGVEFHTSNSVSKLSGEDGSLAEVTLKNGKVLEADAMVIAVGVRPQIQWLEETGIETDRGIIVNQHMQTNIPGVYAAGDCAQGTELITDDKMILATIPVAGEHGLVAGYNMADVPAEFEGAIPLNALQFGKLQMISYGFVKENDNRKALTLIDEDRRIYKKIVLDDNRITGVIFVRAIARAGLFRFLIENKIDVSGFEDKLLDDNFSIASLPTEMQKDMFTKRQSRRTITMPQLQQVSR